MNKFKRKLADIFNSNLIGVLFTSIGMRVVSAAVLFGIGVFLAKWLGPENYGLYTLIFSSASVIGIPINAGLPVLITRETAILVRSDKIDILKGLWSFALYLIIGISFIFGLIYIVYIYYSNSNLFDTLNNYSMIFALVPIIALDRIRGAAMQGLGSSLLAQMPEIILRPFIYFVILLLGFVVCIDDRLFFSLSAYALSAIAAFLFGSYLLNNVMRFNLKKIKSEYQFKMWICSLFSLGMLSSIQTFIGNSDVLLVGYFCTVHDVGIYKVAQQGVALMLIAQTGVSAVVSAKLSQGFANKDMQKIIQISDYAVMIFSTTSVIIFSVYCIFGKSFINFAFGESYVFSYGILIVLALGQMVNSLTGPVMTLLIMKKCERLAFMSVAFGGIFMFSSVIFLVGKYSYLGVGISSSLGVAITNIILSIIVWKKLNFNPTIFSALRRIIKS